MTTMPRTIQPVGWAKPRGYANGMAASGELLAVAGQIGWDEHCTIVSDDFVAQFKMALENVLTVVRTAGGTPTDIISLTVYVTDRNRYLGASGALGQLWRELLGHHYPAMALVEVSALVEARAQVEIQALAVLSPPNTP